MIRVIGLACLLTWCVGFAPATALAQANATDAPADVAAEEDEFVDDFADEDAGPELIVYDPLQPLNRGIFWFNDKLYFYALKPVARGFRYLPESVRVCTSNFFSNLAAPLRALNAVLQAKFNDAGTEFSRFMINSTVGIAGLFDPAKQYAGLRQIDEDFGQTLGVWGFGNGAYLVLPILGPSTVRDGFGTIATWPLDPVADVWQNRDYWAAKTTDVVNTVSLDKDTYEAIVRDSIDPYLFLRDAYVQNRQGRVAK